MRCWKGHGHCIYKASLAGLTEVSLPHSSWEETEHVGHHTCKALPTLSSIYSHGELELSCTNAPHLNRAHMEPIVSSGLWKRWSLLEGTQGAAGEDLSQWEKPGLGTLKGARNPERKSSATACPCNKLSCSGSAAFLHFQAREGGRQNWICSYSGFPNISKHHSFFYLWHGLQNSEFHATAQYAKLLLLENFNWESPSNESLKGMAWRHFSTSPLLPWKQEVVCWN